MLELADKRIVLGLTGGIACYKVAEFLRRAQDQGAVADVVMTEAATHFIGSTTMQALSGRPVYLDAWDARVPNNMAHINLTRGADAIVIAPASTDFIAKLAHGLADDLLSTLCVAKGNCPLLVAPAMNREMWLHPATQRNVAQIKADGAVILGPAEGNQACGEIGSGRMLEPHELLAELIAFFQPKPLRGKRVLITAGPTSEKIDPVRVITNRSSGKMGYAIARAAREAGAQVVLVSGPTALPAPYQVERVAIESAAQMHAAVMNEARDADVFISVAAVADWRVVNASGSKLKKQADGKAPQLEFEANPDILAEVARMPSGPYCVGFAAETENLLEYAEAKRKRKGVPLLVGNLAQQAMNADETELVLFDDAGHTALPILGKLAAARELITAIARKLPGKPTP
ncbi:bifunctional phosphopantothenoylcysteine decarboxylase/phosphopantothenate--cysteine ligase CoaBC [Pollutimonas sp. M17]|uniref:bifunctional phosphopantothenoylcysteine decarboxylase/phosphopantothenate--cysteine ligase CoaBC n=1 Tax=Pollutimonas sp. M17 TaxID=2962065 RepID=UPI0021F41890|nr:bifunctional phosphopantothenoylcysteine decarboxylase/phosphopantothenate--cysteine ligase CoaBC [Pollutimonas sp. M17]UYO95492.1 bifunctional phosphopantothenoylcysteine decarboxylase/phosphopantothenate--cysteine ligase CoaBC [Pollutimonas sp. M17]HWK70503.1 bifunctional phosphopantothenoylcysteine decarboxylase/phosphopantothenate--cysteine ligase CoaBC [Burkholderiaceae bacterium]